MSQDDATAPWYYVFQATVCLSCLCDIRGNAICDCRHCRGGYVNGTPVITYHTGTGAEADHQLGGAIAHVKAMARTRFKITGDLQFITVAGDDDWLGKGKPAIGDVSMPGSQHARQNSWRHRYHKACPPICLTRANPENNHIMLYAMVVSPSLAGTLFARHPMLIQTCMSLHCCCSHCSRPWHCTAPHSALPRQRCGCQHPSLS
jgi:hypothetical protein